MLVVERDVTGTATATTAGTDVRGGRRTHPTAKCQRGALASRACETIQFAPDDLFCAACRAMVGQMESDIAASPGLRAQVLARLQQLAAPEQRVERVRLSDYFTGARVAHGEVQAVVLLSPTGVPLVCRVQQGLLT